MSRALMSRAKIFCQHVREKFTCRDCEKNVWRCLSGSTIAPFPLPPGHRRRSPAPGSHRTKGAETDMPGLPPPRHFPTLPIRPIRVAIGDDRNGA
jgi:hypothetical protein